MEQPLNITVESTEIRTCVFKLNQMKHEKS